MTRQWGIEALKRDLVRQARITGKSNVVKFPLPPLITEPPKDAYAPRNFDEYVGQERAKDICKIIIDAANIEERPIPSILISGSYGLGKTTLARLVMERYGKPYRFINGNSTFDAQALRGPVIIDEVHGLSPEYCDQLNNSLDSGLVQIVAATTNTGELPIAFRSRLRPIDLEDYSEDDIFVILKNALKRKRIVFSKSAAQDIANRSRLNPRNALQILSFALEMAAINSEKKLLLETVNLAMDKLDIDEDGLRNVDRKYLSLLSSIKPTGLTQICAMLGTDPDTIEYEIEPFLLKKGFIERTQRGRLLIESMSDEELYRMLENSIEIKRREKV
jgi:Holliday junction DNA helicase RuvB